MANDYGVQGCNPVYTTKQGLELSPYLPEEKLFGTTGVQCYEPIPGSLVFLGQCTRWDIVYTVCQLARAMSKPSGAHQVSAKHLLRYLCPFLVIAYKAGHF